MIVSPKKLKSVVLEMLFPRPAALRKYDTLHPDVLARTSVASTVQATLPVLAPLPYDHELVRGAVHAAKYHGHERAAALLGMVLAPYVAEELAERRMFGSFTEALVVPLPLHHTREQERGYNQAVRIAEALLSHLNDEGLVLHTEVLKRVKKTAPQAHQTSRLKRSVNVRGAFAVYERDVVQDRHIVLLDDVVTTGATLHAARDALMLAGAKDVMLVSVAH